MILVTGAAGKTGRAVIQALISKGQEVRALVYRQLQKSRLQELGVDDFVIGDMRSRATMDEAVRGVRAIYHIPPNMQPDEVQIGRTVIESAESAGVERFIYHSVLHPQIETMPHHWHKLRVEEMLCESAFAWTILQPAAYMQNISNQLVQIAKRAVYGLPYALEKRLSMVDLRDVAEAAAIVATESGHEYAIYELCGPDLLSGSEIAAVLSEKLGREIRGTRVPIDRWEASARAGGLSTYAIETLLKMFEYYEKHPFRGNAKVLSWLLGRRPTAFGEFLAREIDN